MSYTAQNINDENTVFSTELKYYKIICRTQGIWLNVTCLKLYKNLLEEFISKVHFER